MVPVLVQSVHLCHNQQGILMRMMTSKRRPRTIIHYAVKMLRLNGCAPKGLAQGHGVGRVEGICLTQRCSEPSQSR